LKIGQRAGSSPKVPVNPPALFPDAYLRGKTRFLLTLTNNKWPPRVDPGGHHFVVLNVSINKKLFFVSYVVTNKKAPLTGGGGSRANNSVLGRDPKTEGVRLLVTHFSIISSVP